MRFGTLDFVTDAHASNPIVSTTLLALGPRTQISKVQTVSHISNPQPPARPDCTPWPKAIDCGSSSDHSGHWLLKSVFEEWTSGVETKVGSFLSPPFSFHMLNIVNNTSGKINLFGCLEERIECGHRAGIVGYVSEWEKTWSVRVTKRSIPSWSKGRRKE